MERRSYKVPNSSITIFFFSGSKSGADKRVFGLRQVQMFDGKSGRVVFTGSEWFILLANISRALVEAKVRDEENPK